MRTHGNKSACAYAFFFGSRMSLSPRPPSLIRILCPQPTTPRHFPQPHLWTTKNHPYTGVARCCAWLTREGKGKGCLVFFDRHCDQYPLLRVSDRVFETEEEMRTLTTFEFLLETLGKMVVILPVERPELEVKILRG